MLDLVESRNLQFEVTKRAKPSSSHAEIKNNSHTKTKRREKMRK
jgi:predicted CopG family antitoxin